MQVIAWMTISEMTYNVSSRTLNVTHWCTFSLHFLYIWSCS